MEILLAALTLGFTAGVSPGPLLTLVLTSTLERGFGAGFRVSLAPMLTDGPIILLALVALKDLPQAWLGALGAFGGAYLIYLGVSTVRRSAQPVEIGTEEAASVRDVGRGMLVNLLNPAPWLFWFTVGGPLLVRAGSESLVLALLFLLVFFTLIVGIKILFAWIVARGKEFLTGAAYRRLLVLSGLLLVGLGALLIWRGAASFTG